MFFNKATGYYVDIDELYDTSVKEGLKPAAPKAKVKVKDQAKPANQNKQS